jgi:hypothetical protein
MAAAYLSPLVISVIRSARMLLRTILALALAPALAYGSPRSDPTTGRAVFTGATMPSTTSIGLNPAALGQARTWEIYFAATGVLEQFGIDRRELDLDTDSFTAGQRVRDVQFGPGATIAGIFPPGRITTVGLELRIPPTELFPSDPALRYHSLGSRQRNYIVSGGFSFKVASSFFFGVSVSHDFTDLRLRYARDTALDKGLAIDCGGSPCGLENPAADETYDVTARSSYVSIENVRVNLGILVRLMRNVWLGLSYHNTPGFGIQTQLEGRMQYTQPLREGGVPINGGSTVYVSYPASVDGELRAALLPDLDLHVGGRWEDLSRMQGYDVRGYGRSFDGFGVPEWVVRPRGFRDSFAMWAGVEQVELDQTKRFRFGGRIGFETPSLKPSRTSPGNMSSTSLSLDAGAQIRIAPSWSLQLSYGLQLFSKVDVTTSQYDPRFALDCIDSGFDYETRGCTQLREGYAIPTAAGTYTRLQHAFRLGLRYAPL